jgi:NADPH:quinone reductase-like Zn-dependent oxidoreductase
MVGVTVMRAAICTGYGPPEVLEVQDVAKPVPRDDEVLIKIHATVVTSSDWLLRSGMHGFPLLVRTAMRVFVGVTRPRRPILGLVLAGEVEQAGASVRRFHVGDRVYAFTEFHFGAYAEFTCLRATATVAVAPRNLSYAEAAAIPYGGLLALHYLQKADVQSGQRVLVYGASGAVGTSAVQLAKHFGAEVTAVCGPANVELVRSLGADVVMDYAKEEAPRAGALYDVVFDAVGKRKTSKLKEASRKALAARGKCLSVDDGAPRVSAPGLARLTELVEADKLRPVIDRRYALEQIVEAHRYVEQEHKKGNVVLAVTHEAV